MGDRTEAINRALIKLGVQTVANEDDQSEPARKAKLVFNTLALSELRKHAWSFAIKRDILAYNTVSPAFGYQYQYDQPTDCARVITIGEFYVFNLERGTSTDDGPYLIEGKKLLMNDAGPLKIRYVQDLTATPSLWDACFFEAFASRLARELCNTLKKVAGMKADMDKDYIDNIRQAKRCNAIELPPQNMAEEGYNFARLV